MGNASCLNSQPLNQPVVIVVQGQQADTNLFAGIDFINFLHQQVQNKFFVEFKQEKGIQQYVGVPLQNLGELYNFVKSIKNYDIDFDRLSQQRKKIIQSDIKRDCQMIVDEVKSTLFDLKRNTKRNSKILKVNETKNENNHIDVPFYLPWIASESESLCIYIGQWRYESSYFDKNLPYGVGRLYLGHEVWQGQVQCSLKGIQTKTKSQIQSINQRLNNDSISIKQKILLMKDNFVLNLEGLGRKFNKNEEYYGTFENGKLNGKGSYKNHALQYSYEGHWVNGFKEGKGIEKTKLTYFEGQFYNDKKRGHGTLTFYISTQIQRQRQKQQKQFEETSPNIPQFKQRRKRVKIEMNLEEKSDDIIRKTLQQQIPNYKGEELLTIKTYGYTPWQVEEFPFINQAFVQNLKFQQSLKSNFLEKYVGNFQNDLFQGKGIYHWSKGNFYVGNWVEGKMQGYGKFYWKQGFSYYGEYRKDLKHGKGEMKWDPYKRHRGNWAFGKKHGYGEQIKIQIREDRIGVSIKSGLWKNNELSRENVYFEKFFPFLQNSLQTTLFLSNIEFYYTKLKLSQELKKKLFDEKSKKFHKRPCQICGSYFLKAEEDQSEEPIWRINLHINDNDDEVQPELCRECQKKIEKKDQMNTPKGKQNEKKLSDLWKG